MDSKEHKVLIVIPTYNDADTTIHLIKELSQQSFKKFDILVVDDGSNDYSKIIECFKKEKIGIEGKLIVIRSCENLGPAMAFSIGIRYALEKGYKIIILNDNDSFPLSRDLIESLIRKISEDPSSIYIPNNIYDPRKWSLKNTAPPQFLTIHANTLKKVGYFMKSLYIGGEDVDFSTRASNKYGIKIKFLNNKFYIHPVTTKIEPKEALLTKNTFREMYIIRNSPIVLLNNIKYSKSFKKKAFFFLRSTLRLVDILFESFIIKNTKEYMSKIFSYFIMALRHIHPGKIKEDKKLSRTFSIKAEILEKVEIKEKISKKVHIIKKIFTKEDTMSFGYSSIASFFHNKLYKRTKDPKKGWLIVEPTIKNPILRTLIGLLLVFIFSVFSAVFLIVGMIIYSLKKEKFYEYEKYWPKIEIFEL